MYSKVFYRGIEQMLEKFRVDGADVAVEELKAKFTCRMHDLSEFMKGFKRKDVEKVLAKGGKLSFGECLRCKVRYFSDGMTVGVENLSLLYLLAHVNDLVKSVKVEPAR